MSEETPKLIQFDYKIHFTRNERNYRIEAYNSPWDNDRDLEDIKIIFEGKDLKNNPLPLYKVVKWEELEPAKYIAEVLMVLHKTKDGPHEQHFELKGLNSVET